MPRAVELKKINESFSELENFSVVTTRPEKNQVECHAFLVKSEDKYNYLASALN